MEKIGEIEIRITGKSGGRDLKPDSFDIKHLAELLKDVEDMLYPVSKKDRPLISYDVQKGSVKHLFKTSVQAVIGFSAVLAQIEANNTIDFLEYKTAKAIENVQKISVEKDFVFEFKTSINNKNDLVISPRTKYYISENFWTDGEFYFYGVLKDAGGKTKANIHLDTSEYGYIQIETAEGFLRDQEFNLLYKYYGVRAIGKQNLETGEIDRKSLKLVELIDYNPRYDQDYLDGLIGKAKQNIKGIDVDQWLKDIRGTYEA